MMELFRNGAGQWKDGCEGEGGAHKSATDCRDGAGQWIEKSAAVRHVISSKNCHKFRTQKVREEMGSVTLEVRKPAAWQELGGNRSTCWPKDYLRDFVPILQAPSLSLGYYWPKHYFQKA